jgi:hypothetical protein
MIPSDFLDANNDWFRDKYYDKLSFRYWTQKIALSLFLQIGGDNMVETGCARLEEDWGGGYSTYIYGDFASYYGKKFWTCDIDERNLEVAERITDKFKDNITYVCDDSVRFLRDFDKEINFLYLDSVDCEEGNEQQTAMAQDHQFKEMEQALPKLSKNCVVLLDDNNYANGGKTKASKGFLKENGFLHIMDFQQALFLRLKNYGKK